MIILFKSNIFFSPTAVFYFRIYKYIETELQKQKHEITTRHVECKEVFSHVTDETRVSKRAN